jgi:hypothetical protein
LSPWWWKLYVPFETSALRRPIWHHIPEDGILDM